MNAPTHGIFTVKQWAEFMDCNPQTIRRWVQKYRIPHMKPGDVVFIDAADFWAAIPKVTPGGE